MTDPVVLHLFGVAVGAGLLIGGFVALVNSWLP